MNISKTLILVFILALTIQAQITIPPSKGDRFSYYLVNTEFGEGGYAWETAYDYSSPIIVKVFISPEGYENHWIQNLNLSVSEFVDLMAYLDETPDFFIYGEGRVQNKDETYWRLDSFDIGYEYEENLSVLLDILVIYFSRGNK